MSTALSVIEVTATNIDLIPVGQLRNIVTMFPALNKKTAAFVLSHVSLANVCAYMQWNRNAIMPFPHDANAIMVDVGDVTPSTKAAIDTFTSLEYNTTGTDGESTVPGYVTRALSWVRNTFREATGTYSSRLTGTYHFGLPELGNVVAVAPSRHHDDVAFLLREFSDAYSIDSVLDDESVPYPVGYSKGEIRGMADRVPANLDAAEFTLGMMAFTKLRDGTDEGFDGANVVRLVRMLYAA